MPSCDKYQQTTDEIVLIGNLNIGRNAKACIDGSERGIPSTSIKAITMIGDIEIYVYRLG